MSVTQAMPRYLSIQDELDPPFDPAARFAIYYAPPPESVWWAIGCDWLQRDPAAGATPAAPIVPGLSRPLTELTAEPRRYGWHATLVAPFRCQPQVEPQAMVQHVAEWARRQQPFLLPVQVARLDRFIALQPDESSAAARQAAAAMHALAAGAVHHCAALRAAPTPGELAKRRLQALSARQDELLQAWGYPYVLDEFRFHMTLSNSIDAADGDAIMAWWQPKLAELGPLPVASVAIYVEPEPGADFLLWQRLPLGGGVIS